MPAKFGIDCKLYRQSTGTRAAWPETGAAPELLEIANIDDEVTVPLEKSEADATPRGSNFEVVAAKVIRGPIGFTLQRTGKTADNAHITAIRTAYIANTTVAFAVLDGDSETAGSEGVWGDFEILQFQRREPKVGLVVYDVQIKPGISDVAPEWVVVST